MEDNYELVIRLVVAAVLGSIIGLERERLENAAGLRTHALVGIGSCLAMIVSAYGFNQVVSTGKIDLDPSRVAAQVVSGVGFLGAGTILLRRNVVKGLTTAASIWSVASIGLAVGGGLYVPAVASTLLIVVFLAAIKPLEQRYFKKPPKMRILLKADVKNVALAMEEINSIIKHSDFTLHRINVDSTCRDDSNHLEISLLQINLANLDDVINTLKQSQQIMDVRPVECTIE